MLTVLIWQAGVVEEPERQPGRPNSPIPNNDLKDSQFQKRAKIVGLAVPKQLNSRVRGLFHTTRRYDLTTSTIHHRKPQRQMVAMLRLVCIKTM
jgi:hypothetical protein